jgi:uncharacterized protein
MAARSVQRVFLASLCAMLLPMLGRAAVPLVEKARDQIDVTTSYDPAYKKMAYPGGDVPKETGVCSDVVVRAFRGLKIDLQKEVHEDMTRAFDQYPRKWGLKRPDSNIDHRRVPNLMTCFQRQGWTVSLREKAGDFQAGDAVAWDLGGGVTHIGIVSDRRSAEGTPVVIHKIGRGVQEENNLFEYEIIGHDRPQLNLEDRPTEPVPHHAVMGFADFRLYSGRFSVFIGSKQHERGQEFRFGWRRKVRQSHPCKIMDYCHPV